jgi:putative ABC transport system permease protein
VGQAVFAGILDVPEASWGAAVDASDLEALGAGEGNGAGAVIGLVDGADRDRFARRIESELDEEVATVEQPIELARLREIEAFPWILTSFLGAVGLLAVLNAVVTTARRRAGDLAVLRSLGLAPRGVFRAVTVQSGVLTGLGLAVGIPFGLVIGQQLWRAVAGSLGVVVSVAIPWYAIALVAVAGVAASTMFAIVPARAAARRPIADALRAE